MNKQSSEEKRLARAKRNQEKRDRELAEKHERRKRRESKIREQAQKDLATINNVKIVSEKTKDSLANYNKKAGNTKSNSVGSSLENKKWEKKRLSRYHQRVWREWRESDGESHPVKTYHISDLDN
ncbi:hypothetical protein G3M81_02250 [Bacillus paralicheniformis]|uniref:hypothetical protein n=1 Tax=Bacillus paralicheniformis TaxID=1648923 RepID=UPI0013EF1C05|nr:hypothetical protein [Bacillus paralicheniformis]QII47646.1 hypothetical protein G3M81_02250 [Bacillus paralicheniformis]